MSQVPDLLEFREEHGLKMISIAELIRHRRQNEAGGVAEGPHPDQWGGFTCYGYESLLDGPNSTWPWCPAPCRVRNNVLVRVRSRCLTGDIFGSLRCDCGVQLDAAISPRRSWASWCTCGATRNGGIGIATSCRPTACWGRPNH